MVGGSCGASASIETDLLVEILLSCQVANGRIDAAPKVSENHDGYRRRLQGRLGNGGVAAAVGVAGGAVALATSTS